MWGRAGQLRRQASDSTTGAGAGGGPAVWPWWSLARGPAHSAEGATEASKGPPNLGDKNPGFARDEFFLSSLPPYFRMY